MNPKSNERMKGKCPASTDAMHVTVTTQLLTYYRRPFSMDLAVLLSSVEKPRSTGKHIKNILLD
jgi:hypothetical protein